MVVERDGKPYQVSTYRVEFGPKNGAAHVTVYDPCISEAARKRRREAVARKCEGLIQQGLM